MKKIILAAALIAAVSCAKQQENNNYTPGEGSSVTICFAPESVGSKAFFDPTTTTETWEKSLSALTIYTFDATDNLLVERRFTATEVADKRAIFSLPRSSAGTTCEFFAVANKSLSGITTKASLLAQLDAEPSSYNGTFAQVSSKAPAGGYTMSGSVSKTIAAAGASTDVVITLKRTVAKIAIQATLAADFSSRYTGSVRISSAEISRAASQTKVIAPATPAPAAMDFTFSQTTAENSGKFNNLFYIYENGVLAAGSRVMVTLTGIYDRDGNFSTATDQTPVSYQVELNGAASNGLVARNGYYRVAITIAGLTGQDVDATILVADWETPITQNINLGQ